MVVLSGHTGFDVVCAGTGDGKKLGESAGRGCEAILGVGNDACLSRASSVYLL